jgi:hypothetical protein
MTVLAIHTEWEAVVSEDAELGDNQTIRKMSLACCASADRKKRKEQNAQSKVVSCYAIFLLRSLDHSIRSRQHVRRNREADLLGRFQIDH